MTNRLPLTILIIGTILSCWLLWHYVLTYQWQSSANPKNPDEFAYGLQINKMDNNGQLQYAFYSPFLLHYSIDDRTTFQKPVAQMFEIGQPPWIMHADQGESFHGDDTVNLWGNVIVSQAAGQNNVSSEIKTTKVTLYPKTRIATTDQYAIAVQPNAQMSSVGMKWDAVNQTLDLFSQVHGVYVPAKN